MPRLFRPGALRRLRVGQRTTRVEFSTVPLAMEPTCASRRTRPALTTGPAPLPQALLGRPSSTGQEDTVANGDNWNHN
jgi:hypothetical protein